VRLKRTGHELRLTAAAMETLAVIAYKQPVMRAEVESVRGVACAELIRQLMEKGLVRIAGRHDSLGRPQLYGTTKKFLQAFGLNSLKDLPEVDTLKNRF
jgi:segregation and condensation protein B